MFVLITTVDLYEFKHARVLFNIYSNGLKTYGWIYMYIIYTCACIFVNIQVSAKFLVNHKN